MFNILDNIAFYEVSEDLGGGKNVRKRKNRIKLKVKEFRKKRNKGVIVVRLT